MSQHGRKRSASCREEPQSSTSAWEPASKRLRTLVHQMRSLSLGDLPWSRRKIALDVPPPDPPPTPDPTPVLQRRLLAAPITAAAVTAAATAAAARTPPRQDTIPTVSQATGLSFTAGGGLSGGYSTADDAGTHGDKRNEDEPGGSRAKKARNRMRLGQTGVAMTSCYIEQTLYT